MADKIVCESKNSMTEISNKVKSVKKEVEHKPSYPDGRAIDLPFGVLSVYISDMERMRENFESDVDPASRAYRRIPE